LLIYRSLRPLISIRDIPLRPGLNLVWAREPDHRDGLATLQRAGHGVGKSTFCLMLRSLLGDTGKAVRLMREKLAVEFPNGGMAAVVHFGCAAWSVFRPFAANTHGQAAESVDLEALLNGGEHVPFQSYLDALGATILLNLHQRHIPGTGQAIEWTHVLSWLTRDQGTRLSGYFDWRSTEGTGLQGARRAPPWVVRSVLALTNTKEVEAAGEAGRLEDQAVQLERDIRNLESEPRLIRARIEADFRRWVGASEQLAFDSDDLFKSSVLEQVRIREQEIEVAVAAIDDEIEAQSRTMAELVRDIDVMKQQAEIARANVEEAEALRDQKEDQLKEARAKLNKLKNLAGPCQYGAVEFQQCEHIRNRLRTPSFQDGRDQRTVQQNIEHWAAEAKRRKPILEDAERSHGQAQRALEAASREMRKLQMKRATEDGKRHFPGFLRDSMKLWEGAAGQASSPTLATKRMEFGALSGRLNEARLRVQNARGEQSLRQSQLTEIFDGLAQEIGLHGRFLLNDDSRPFELVGSAGEAYSVLEILLGDFACALDAENGTTSFPAFLIHDCPREADLSVSLYGDYLQLLVARETSEPCWQGIVTTTTPPPKNLRERPYLALELNPTNENDLLLRTRFGLREWPQQVQK
jgi:hypothetical protein